MEDKIRAWIEKKLEEGVERDRIKNVLEEKDHDPSLVDEVQDPFDATDKEETEDFFGETEEPGNTVEQERSHDSQEKEESESIILNRLKDIDFDTSRLVKPGAALLVVLLLVGGYAFVGQEAVNGLLSNEHLKGCRDVGVMVQDVSVENDQTVAQVEVVRNKSIAILEVWQDNKKLGESQATFIGEKEMIVDAVGNRVRFHPAECMRYVSERPY
ncbi:MAG: hypothetical protein H8Z69_02015 [Nanohaloarchaea archaeon]|nr:hypothetical protein [Candidatus Nanohaloarchaea archaeon]